MFYFSCISLKNNFNLNGTNFCSKIIEIIFGSRILELIFVQKLYLNFFNFKNTSMFRSSILDDKIKKTKTFFDYIKALSAENRYMHVLINE